MIKLIVGLLFVGLNFYIYNYLSTDEVIPPRTPFAEMPLELEDWRCTNPEKMDEPTLKNLGATDYLLCTFMPAEAGTPPIGVYVGYHETQVRKEGGGAGENSIHPPEHCLPGGGWDIVDSRVVPLDLEDLPEGRIGGPEAKRFVIAKGHARALVYFWYQSRGRVLARNHEVILYRFLDRATKQRTDGSLVRFTVPIYNENEEAAEETFRAFAPLLVEQLPPYVPQ